MPNITGESNRQLEAEIDENELSKSIDNEYT